MPDINGYILFHFLIRVDEMRRKHPNRYCEELSSKPLQRPLIKYTFGYLMEMNFKLGLKHNKIAFIRI